MDKKEMLQQALMNFIQSGDFKTVLNSIEFRKKDQFIIGDLFNIRCYQRNNNEFEFTVNSNGKNGFTEATKTI